MRSSWRRLIAQLAPPPPVGLARDVDAGAGLWSMLHRLRRASSLAIDLRPGVDEKSVREASFVNVIKGDTKEQAAHIGYAVTGRIRAEGELAIERQEAFAVVQIGSQQFKVTPGDCLFVERLKHTDVNDLLVLNKVLLLGTRSDTVVGRPRVPNATVSALVEEHAHDARVIVFKKKRRKNYRRCKGHHQMLTRIRITRILGLEEYLPEEDKLVKAIAQ